MPRPIKISGDTLTYTSATGYVLTLNERGAPNLDGQSVDWLMAFWHMTYIGGWAPARFLFPDRPKGYVGVTRALGNYAANKATAQGCREKGNISGALVYERIADTIYERDLPDYARW